MGSKTDHKDLLQAMVTYHHLGKRDVLAFLRSAHPGQNKSHVAGSLNYSVTVGNMTTFLQAGRGGADRTAQQAAVQSFDGEEVAKRQRRHEEVSAAISAGQLRRYDSDASIRERLSERLKALWDSGWGDVMRVMWQQSDMREKMRDVMSSDEVRERLQQMWAADGRLDWFRAVTREGIVSHSAEQERTPPFP